MLKRIALISLLLSPTCYASMSAVVKAQALPAIGYRNQTVYIICNHEAWVTNSSGQAQLQTIYYKLCADNQYCQTRGFKIKVNPGTWHDTYKSSIYATYKNAGHYRIDCATNAQGLAQQEDSNSVTIT